MEMSASRSLEQLSERYWQERLANDPLMATALGDRRFDGELPDVSPAGRARSRNQYEDVVQACGAIEEAALRPQERLTRTSLLIDARSQVEYALCNLEEWTVDPLHGPQVEMMNVQSYQPVKTPEEGRALARRWRGIGPYMDQHIANLSIGAASGRFATRKGVEKVIDELQDLLAKPDAEWALLKPLEVDHSGWSDEDNREFRTGLIGAVRETARPGFARYLQFLESEVLPRSKPQDRPGISHIPGGGEDYARLIRVHTSLDLTAKVLHQTGLAEVSRINEEMRALGKKVFGTEDRQAIMARLRTDPSLYFSDGDEVEAKARAALARANAAIGKWFGRLPRTPCEVVRMEKHEEKHSTIAYYLPPAADGSRPGRYYINTSAPETRPRYEAEALAYHESVPGHHLQIAIAQELVSLPQFRRNSGVTAFIEGWGLYSERLADEMGLYSSDLDRMGMLSFDAWRACRLVVDTGMHSLGWTRAQAIEYMMQNTALASNNIVNEVDRYITWPGQALAYKTGQLEMLALRRKAGDALADKFDIREFHDALLGSGAVPLEALRELIADYTHSRE